MTTSLAASWPGSPAFVVAHVDGSQVTPLLTHGDLDAVRPWASVSKVAVGLGVMRAVEAGLVSLNDAVGPPGATLAHLLSHASGLGYEVSDRVVPVGTRRVYSNCGIDHAAAHVAEADPLEWLRDSVLRPLALPATDVEERVAAGVHGPTSALVRVGAELLSPTLMSLAARDTMITPFLPLLDGITPPFGRQTPNFWGLGPEIRGAKRHWMGDWPDASFGHFGRSGALLLCDPTTQVVVAATSTEPFGPWAVALWPTWINEIRNAALS